MRRAPAFCQSGSCRGSVGKRRRPRPINRHASTEAAGFWGPRCSVLDLSLRHEAKPERALGPGATVGVLGTGVPRLACLRPAAWLKGRPSMAHLHQHELKTLARGQASRGGRQEASSGTASSGWLARRRRDQGRVPREEPVTQAMTIKTRRAPGGRQPAQCPCFLFGAKGASAGESIKQRHPFRCNKTKTSPTAGWRSQWSPSRRHHQSL